MRIPTIVFIMLLLACASDSYQLPDGPRGDLKPQYSEQDVALQEELVEGWRIKCIKSGRNKYLCGHYENEHGLLQNFYYLPMPE